MKRWMLNAGLVAVMVLGFSFSLAQAKTDKILEAEALELSAGMQVLEWQAVYEPLRDLAKAAGKEGKLKEAADLWVKAAYRHRVPTYRAAALRNAAYFSARISDCQRARRLWFAARDLLESIDQFPELYPLTEKMEASGKKTAADINWGFMDSACRDR